ncbi:MAG: hypothetical protein HGA65_19655 [Oscillochloris sp.]|nr:hypothetical protein [Oscillochloris sp.]
MESDLATIIQAAPGRLLGLAHDGDVRLVWDNATIRLPVFDMPHLAALLDSWEREEELPLLRRGYYRIARSPEGQIQLWINRTGLLLSREELRILTGMVATATHELCQPLCRQPATPFGLGYRRLTVTPRHRDRHN